MRRFFDLLKGDEIIPDDTGIEVRDLATAEKMALQAIEDIRNEACELGASWCGWRLDIMDASGRTLLSIPLNPNVH